MLRKTVKYLRWKLKGEVPVEHLIQMGLKVGKNFNKQQECIIDYCHCWLISIGDNVTLAPRVHILAHDASTKYHLNYAKIGLVTIGNNVFIGANTTVLPNVTIGDNVIIGAGSVVSKDIPSNSVAAGNPAKVICSTDEYIEKNKNLMASAPTFNEDWTTRKNISDEMKKQMVDSLKKGMGFVE